MWPLQWCYRTVDDLETCPHVESRQNVRPCVRPKFGPLPRRHLTSTDSADIAGIVTETWMI